MHTEHLKITGMTCAGYSSKVTHALKNDVSVSLSPGQAAVQYDGKITSPDQSVSAVRSFG